MQDVETGSGPTLHELVGVYFGPAAIRVIEVAPRQCVDPTDATLVESVGDFTEFAKLVSRHGTDDRAITAGPCGYHRGACWT
jgi:hypothetical protein